MATTPNSVILPQSFNQAGLSFAAADTNTFKSLITAGANGSIIRAISAWSNDTAAINLVLEIFDGVNAFRIGTVRIPTLSGTDGAVVAKNILNNADMPFLTLDANGNPYLSLKAGYVLKVGCLVTITAAKLLELYCQAEDL